jgi:hypothetical protein
MHQSWRNQCDWKARAIAIAVCNATGIGRSELPNLVACDRRPEAILTSRGERVDQSSAGRWGAPDSVRLAAGVNINHNEVPRPW